MAEPGQGAPPFREDPAPEFPKFHAKPSKEPTSKTFVFGNEDHTLGNSLRHVVMQDARTDFCGYSIPHPSEPLLHIRIQTTGEEATEVLRSGLQNLTECCDHIKAVMQNKIAERK
jgi:DNA-directed RNA polymerase I and III subunit RPAC2